MIVHRQMARAMNLGFLGAAGTVTGSRYLLETSRKRILIDCGLFQGVRALRERNWNRFPVNPASIDVIVLTHAHIDHSGYLPVMIKQGFSGSVLCTEATRDLLEILLPDSGYLQEKDAEFANKHGFSRHHPALPLYTLKDGEISLKQVKPVPFGETQDLDGELKICFLPAGHILGAAIVILETQARKIVFSGDLGRQNSSTMVDPTLVRQADFLVVESTYGDRRHEQADPEDVLADIVNRTTARGGSVLVPAFAVGRTQSLLFHFQRLKAGGRIGAVPIFIDSPMAINASKIFCAHPKDHRLTESECLATCDVARYVREVEDSKRLDNNPMPKVLISASGMATGGRVLHHLKRMAEDSRNTIVLTGFQAPGTRGAALESGATKIKIHGQTVTVRCEVKALHMLSAHADADEILFWLSNFELPPRKTFITHGEPAASHALYERIRRELGWACHIPKHKEQTRLT